MYDGITRRRDSFESDRQSIANSVFTVSGAATSSARSVYGSGPHAAGSGFFAAPGNGMTGLTPYTSNASQGGASPAGGAWAGQPRNRTSSSSTQAAQAAYAPGSKMGNADWRRSVDSTRTNGARSIGGPGDHRPSTGGQSVAGASSIVPSKRGPLVYPAMLSKVARAFKEHIPITERTKDGLSYKDAFDGREAVDKIAFIIKTSDRNLALLLGRALDAQKFFHDVTYDHRLRDSPNELYQFRVRLAAPFGSEDDGLYQDAPTFYDPSQSLTLPPRQGNQIDSGSSLGPSVPGSSAASMASPSPGAEDGPSHHDGQHGRTGRLSRTRTSTRRESSLC